MGQSAPRPLSDEVPPTAIVLPIKIALLSGAIVVHSIATFIPTPKRDLNASAMALVREPPENFELIDRSRPERI